MPITLRGPVKMHDVANLMESITDSYYRWCVETGYVKRYGINMVFWDESMITFDEVEKLPTYEGSYIQTNYKRAMASKRKVSLLKKASPEFVVAINSNMLRPGKNWYDHFKTRIVNKTLIEDIISGQTISPTVCEFVFSTWSLESRIWFDEFVGYRNKLIRQAQARLDQSVSGAAFKLLKDLA